MKGQVEIAFIGLLILFFAFFLLSAWSPVVQILFVNNAASMPELSQTAFELIPIMAVIFLVVVFFMRLRGV